jgi:hypothetical protein
VALLAAAAGILCLTIAVGFLAAITWQNQSARRTDAARPPVIQSSPGAPAERETGRLRGVWRVAGIVVLTVLLCALAAAVVRGVRVVQRENASTPNVPGDLVYADFSGEWRVTGGSIDAAPGVVTFSPSSDGSDDFAGAVVIRDGASGRSPQIRRMTVRFIGAHGEWTCDAASVGPRLVGRGLPMYVPVWRIERDGRGLRLVARDPYSPAASDRSRSITVYLSKGPAPADSPAAAPSASTWTGDYAARGASLDLTEHLLGSRHVFDGWTRPATSPKGGLRIRGTTAGDYSVSIISDDGGTVGPFAASPLGRELVVTVVGVHGGGWIRDGGGLICLHHTSGHAIRATSRPPFGTNPSSMALMRVPRIETVSRVPAGERRYVAACAGLWRVQGIALSLADSKNSEIKILREAVPAAGERAARLFVFQASPLASNFVRRPLAISLELPGAFATTHLGGTATLDGGAVYWSAPGVRLENDDVASSVTCRLVPRSGRRLAMVASPDGEVIAEFVFVRPLPAWTWAPSYLQQAVERWDVGGFEGRSL